MDPYWKTLIETESQKDYFQQLMEGVKRERQKHTVFPPPADTFRAFVETPFAEVKVVILGQDPYHNSGQANGLSFSVPEGMKVPPSLQNIYKELSSDLGCPTPTSGCLLHWAKQGVFLLNAVLTVRAHEAGSHKWVGWETFTNEVIRVLGGREDPIVFVLWGAYAKAKKNLIGGHHCVIESPHPSPFSSYQGFFGSRPFSKANKFLVSVGKTPIVWSQ